MYSSKTLDVRHMRGGGGGVSKKGGNEFSTHSLGRYIFLYQTITSYVEFRIEKNAEYVNLVFVACSAIVY